MSSPLFAPQRLFAERDGSENSDRAEPRVFRRGREAAALLLVAGAVLLALALGSFVGDPQVPEVVGPNWVGPVGAAIAQFLVSSVGVMAWAVPVELVLMAVPLFRDRPSIASLARIGGDVTGIFVLSALVHVAFSDRSAFGGMTAAGAVGELFGEVMCSLFSTVGSYILGITAVGLLLIARASFSFISLAQRAGAGTGQAARWSAEGVRLVAGAWSKARALERSRAANAQDIPIETAKADEAIIAEIDEELAAASEEARAASLDDLPRISVNEETPEPESVPPVGLAGEDSSQTPDGAATTNKRRGRRPPEADEAASEEDPSWLEAATDTTPAKTESSAKRKRRRRSRTPKIVEFEDKSEQKDVPAPAQAEGSNFQSPPTDLLDAGSRERLVVDEDLQEELNDIARQLITTLNHYGVRGEVREIQPGPTVTTFEVEPEAGTKVSKIASLADDLAMNLGCQVRIIAPIPGKKRVGFEVPNKKRMPVNLRELVEDRRFGGMKAPLPVVLGRDIVGAPYYADLASMPHVLVAGATGAGKSVGLNVMLISLLYRRSPEDLRLLMVDPKVVELQSYDRIPHMLLPVVTDTRQASNALKWAVDEMERRYQLLANAGTKNIKTYNAWVERVLRGEVRGWERPEPTVETSPDGSLVEFGPAKEPPKLPEKLPYIVIVVDEFADLMMQQGKDVEAAIARLAQKARAAGMHVILATQRPSVDVITGMIKANFPTRIAFKVTQRIDSRTILDEQGADHLLGKGDMLVKMNGTNETRRVQCPFVSEEEVDRVTGYLRQQGAPTYDETILQPRDEDGGDGDGTDGEQDSKYDDAVQVVAETRRCSTSWLQRKLGIGYNRAAKIVETMEKRGLVGPAQGAKEREVLIDPL